MAGGWLRRIFGGGARSDGAQGVPGDVGTGTAAARASAGSGAGAPDARPWMDLAALMAIRSIELRVRRLVEGLNRGIHRSVRRGYSTEFTEYRPYTPGDDLRHMDWRRLARTDRPYVRQYEDESDWGCAFVADLSASMAYGSTGHTKGDYARTLVGTLAAFLHGQGDAVGLLRFARGNVGMVPARHTPRQLTRFWPLLEADASGAGSALGEALEGASLLLKRPGLVVVASDFLTAPASWSESLRALRAARHEVVCFEVLDPQELEFSFEGDTRFENLESPLAVELDAAGAREAYLEKLRVHREEVVALCARESVPLFEARTDAPLEPVLRAALSAVSRLRPQGGARRNGSGGGG